jgi:hypothetical protein
MWLPRPECIQLISYLRCTQRYLHHAMLSDEDWAWHQRKYVNMHKQGLVCFVNSLGVSADAAPDFAKCKEMGLSLSGPFVFSWSAAAIGIPCIILRVCVNPMLNRIWVRNAQLACACHCLLVVDEMISNAIRPEYNYANPVKRSLGHMRWLIGTYLYGSGCKDMGDNWP